MNLHLPEGVLLRLVAGKLRTRTHGYLAGRVGGELVAEFVRRADLRIDSDPQRDSPLRKNTRAGRVKCQFSVVVQPMAPHIWWTIYYAVFSVRYVGTMYGTVSVAHRGYYLEVREERLSGGTLLQDCFFRNSEMEHSVLVSRRYL